MAGCIPNSLFLSEVLVILSSCVFVVMALLTAVVSVTSITFIDKNEVTTEPHCHLPNRFYIKSNFDLPSYSTIFSQLFPQVYERSDSVINSFRFLILSSLRDTLIERNIIDKNLYLSIFSDNLIQIIEKSLKNHKIDYNISNIPLNAIHSLFSQSNNNEYIPFSKITNLSLNGKFTFNLTSPSFLFDIEAIKTNLVNKSKPLSISLPFDLISYLQNDEKFESSFLSKYAYAYLIYGWNNDFILENPSPLNKEPLTGGFIVRQFIQEAAGHSISYFYGHLTNYEEGIICPQLNNFQSLNFQNKIQLTCINYQKCNAFSNYILEPLSNFQNIDVKDELPMNINLLEISQIKNPKRIIFDSFDELSQSFLINDQFVNDQCNFFFLPYDILTEIFAQSKTEEQLAYGISSSINWSIPDNIDLSKFIAKISDRPTPLFEI